jgi:carbohydrate-selective porin OprB
MTSGFSRSAFAVFISALAVVPSLRGAAPSPESPSPLVDQFLGNPPKSVTGNPAAESDVPGTGLAGRLLHLPKESGLRIGGLWLADSNGLISGGAQPGKWSFNSALIIGANLDAEKLIGWQGASSASNFSNSTVKTPTAKPAACRAITASPAPNLSTGPNSTSSGIGRLCSMTKSTFVLERWFPRLGSNAV